jgi:uncharacterized membrane protein (UPF0127 family)
MKILNRTQGTIVGSRITLADSWWGRFRGFLGRSEPLPGDGILLAPCDSIHTFGMRFPLDVIFLDADGRVLGLHPVLRPWRIARGKKGVRYVLEVPSGTIDATGTQLGDELSWAPKDQVLWWKQPTTDPKMETVSDDAAMKRRTV